MQHAPLFDRAPHKVFVTVCLVTVADFVQEKETARLLKEQDRLASDKKELLSTIHDRDRLVEGIAIALTMLLTGTSAKWRIQMLGGGIGICGGSRHSARGRAI